MLQLAVGFHLQTEKPWLGQRFEYDFMAYDWHIQIQGIPRQPGQKKTMYFLFWKWKKLSEN